MSEVKNEVVEQAAVQAEESKMKLSKVYDFEGAKVSEIDFSDLENLTANDMIKANKVLNTSGNVTVLPETIWNTHSSSQHPQRITRSSFTSSLHREMQSKSKTESQVFSSERNKNRRTVGTPKVMPCLVNEPGRQVWIIFWTCLFLTF